jgi:hypothetical protein
MKQRLIIAVAYLFGGSVLAACDAPAGSLAPAAIAAPAKTAATKGAFLYVAVNYGVNIFTYPSVKLVASLSNDESFPRVCSDPKTGHVFVSQTAELDEYERGGTTVIGKLEAPPGYTSLQGCSIDPISGDLAVVAYDGYKGGGLLVYPHARGTPRAYSDPTVHAYYYCSYDDSGNVFVLGYGVGSQNVFLVFTELRNGRNAFRDLRLNEDVGFPEKIQWDGKHIAINIGAVIYRVTISGSNAKVAGFTRLLRDPMGAGGISWIAGDTVLGAYGGDFAVRLGVWPYPAGGGPTRITPPVTTENNLLSDINLSEPPPR